MLVVQDLFLTKTAELADVVLPATAAWAESRGHGHELGATRPARAGGRGATARRARRPGDHLRPREPDGRRLGRAGPGDASGTRSGALSPVHAGMSYARLEELGGLQWPCYDEDHPGELFLHSRLWEDPVPGNRVPFVPVEHDPPVDRLTDDFPIRLTTGRRLDSYNTGVQTAGYTSPLRRGESLDISPEDAAAYGLADGEVGAGRVAPRPGRGPDPDRRIAPTRADVHDDALPGRGRGQPPDDRRHGPQVRHRRVQGHGDPDREARGAGRDARVTSTHPDAPDGKARKYARVERERRFLLAEPPADAASVGAMRVEDRYLIGTRLRLRRMTAVLPDGTRGSVVTKLAQKVPGGAGPWGLITNLYLSPAEYDAIAALPADTVTKLRTDHGTFVVDLFEGALAGLTIAEVEFEDDATAEAFVPTFDYVVEITTDVRFTGGRLATTDRSTLLGLLRESGHRPPGRRGLTSPFAGRR